FVSEPSFLLKKYHGGHVVIRLALGGATKVLKSSELKIAVFKNLNANLRTCVKLQLSINVHDEKICANWKEAEIRELLTNQLAGFFLLHPMTITEAERRQKAALIEEVKTHSQEQVEQKVAL
uniref:Uncharacterized protein n=1 Tax=Sinocyclocheilus rhinocerous TaxID=307959 RepID=A0A673NFX2_9TELE